MKDRKGNEKIIEYDVLRVLVTLLVVIGHATYYKVNTAYGGVDYSKFATECSFFFKQALRVTDVIYIFHMQLFMALSGALFYISFHKKNNTFKIFTSEKAKRLVIPFFAVNIFYSLPLKFLAGYYNNSTNILKDYIWGQILLQGNTYLWYIATLFLVYLVAYALEKYINSKFSFIKLIILFIISLSSRHIELKILSYLCEYMFWFYVGFYFEKNRLVINKKSRKVCLLLSFIVFGISYIGTLRPNEVFYTIAITCATIAGMFGTYEISLSLSNSKLIQSNIFRLFVQDSFGIYLYSDPLNYIIMALGTGIFGKIIFSTIHGSVLMYLTRIVITLVWSIGITELLKKLKIKYVY